jgi:hypothetical protein
MWLLQVAKEIGKKSIIWVKFNVYNSMVQKPKSLLTFKSVFIPMVVLLSVYAVVAYTW